MYQITRSSELSIFQKQVAVVIKINETLEVHIYESEFLWEYQAKHAQLYMEIL